MLFVLYLSLYCVGQFILFIWRDNDIVALDLKQAQITAIVVQAVLVFASYFILLKPWIFDPAYAGVDEDDDSQDVDEDDDGQAVGDYAEDAQVAVDAPEDGGAGPAEGGQSIETAPDSAIAEPGDAASGGLAAGTDSLTV
jgi:hypothetical protein